MFDSNPVLQRCRNPRCKTWLKEPVENRRNAFCCSGCEAGFYRRHCRVCERPFEAKNSRKQLCGRDRCEHEFQRNKPRFFSDWYPTATLAAKPEKSSTKSTPKTTIKSDRGFVVAGPPGTVGSQVSLTAYDLEVLRENFRVNAGFWNAAALIKAHHPPVNILGGFKFPNAPAAGRGLLAEIISTELGEFKSAKAEMTPQDQARFAALRAQIPDDLSIPLFLRRGDQ